MCCYFRASVWHIRDTENMKGHASFSRMQMFREMQIFFKIKKKFLYFCTCPCLCTGRILLVHQSFIWPIHLLVVNDFPHFLRTHFPAFFKREIFLNFAFYAWFFSFWIPVAMAAVLAAGAPEHAPFMADESMLSIPGLTPLAYTEAAYNRYTSEVKECVKRLNKEGTHTRQLSLFIGTVPILSPEMEGGGGGGESNLTMCPELCKGLSIVMYRKFRNVPFSPSDLSVFLLPLLQWHLLPQQKLMLNITPTLNLVLILTVAQTKNPKEVASIGRSPRPKLIFTFSEYIFLHSVSPL